MLTFTEPTGLDDDSDGDPDFWVEVGFGELSYVVIRAGANQSGSVGLSFLFEGLEWVDEPTPVAVALVAHDLTYDLNGADGTAPDSQSSCENRLHASPFFNFLIVVAVVVDDDAVV